MIRPKLIGLVSNKRQLVLYKTAKHSERIVLFVVKEKHEMILKNLVVTQNVTRDFSICLEHISLILSQIVMKL
jgi:hypothetical protein